MGTLELDSKIKELRELRRMADEIAAEIETIQDTIKNEMLARSVDELAGTDWRATWKNVTTTRLDSTKLKKAAPQLFDLYSKTTTARRFVLA